jgi:hypothetical protein
MLKDRTIAPDPMMIGLQALAWVLSDDARAERLLALTGLTPDDLRAAAGETGTIDAVLGFLEAHQPDLIGCAEALSVKPEALVSAREALNR